MNGIPNVIHGKPLFHEMKAHHESLRAACEAIGLRVFPGLTPSRIGCVVQSAGKVSDKDAAV